VGGGIVGLAVAYELARRGRRVLVLDRDDLPGVATRAAAGMLAPTSEADLTDPAVVPFELDSLRRYPGFVGGVETLAGRACGYRTEGTLWVALDRDQAGELERLAAFQRAKGFLAEPLTPDAVLAREPRLSGRVISGLLVEGDHQVDPRALAGALEAAVEALGGRVARGVRVRRVEHAAGRVRGVSGTAGAGPAGVACEVVVLAAGAWAGEIAAPLPPLGLRPVKGQLVRLRGPALVRHVVRTPDVYLVPRRDGELLVGATMEEQGFDPTATAGAAMDLLREAWRLLPGIYELGWSELSVGFRPAVRDHRPVIGRAGVDGLFVATGHHRNGVLLAPATAHHLAEWIVGGQRPAALEAFGVDRLAPPPAAGGAGRHATPGAPAPAAGGHGSGAWSR
jgi:glycine oxidase